ncbi:MAG TPA: hypothetical protein VLA13_02625 [Massilibacterium sp.]|nr:hypothetical protein [Massilibacterium sp.]
MRDKNGLIIEKTFTTYFQPITQLGETPMIFTYKALLRLKG